MYSLIVGTLLCFLIGLNSPIVAFIYINSRQNQVFIPNLLSSPVTAISKLPSCLNNAHFHIAHFYQNMSY